MIITRPGIYFLTNQQHYGEGSNRFTLFPGRIIEVTDALIDSVNGRIFLSDFCEWVSWEIPATRLLREDETPQYRVSLFNKAAGRKPVNLPKPNASVLSDQMKLIVEEVEETTDALLAFVGSTNTEDKIKSLAEIRDGLCDILVTTYGLSYLLSIDTDKDMKLVCDSNESKLHKTFEEACETVDMFAILEVSTYIEDPINGLIAVKTDPAKAQKGTDGVLYPPNKIVKGINYEKPDWNAFHRSNTFYFENNL